MADFIQDAALSIRLRDAFQFQHKSRTPVTRPHYHGIELSGQAGNARWQIRASAVSAPI
ncbi:MAG: hypothetical protein AAFZ74_10195 [Pseudomonadota bacterium]